MKMVNNNLFKQKSNFSIKQNGLNDIENMKLNYERMIANDNLRNEFIFVENCYFYNLFQIKSFNKKKIT